MIRVSSTLVQNFEFLLNICWNIFECVNTVVDKEAALSLHEETGHILQFCHLTSDHLKSVNNISYVPHCLVSTVQCGSISST